MKAYLSTLCAVVACERSDAFRTGDAEIRYDPQFGAAEEDHRLPLVSCVDSFSSKRKLSLAARLEPDEVVLAGKPSWTPVDIVDAAALDSGFVILDRGAAEVTLVSNELQVLRTWGRRGGGPGEFQAPAAVTVDQSGDTIWVLDAAPPRLVGFDRLGRIQRDFRLPVLGFDVTTDAHGNFYIAQRPMLTRSSQSGTTPLPLVTMFSREGTPLRTLHSAVPGNHDDPRVNLPGFVQPQLSSLGNRIAVSYPASGIVDIYDAGELAQTVQLCMPPDLKSAYDRQLREVTANTRSQQSIALISDVHLARQGEVSVISLIKTQDGFLHVDQFAANGKPLGSIGLTSTSPTCSRSFWRILESVSIDQRNRNAVVVCFRLKGFAALSLNACSHVWRGAPPRQVVEAQLPAEGIITGAFPGGVALVEFGSFSCPTGYEFSERILSRIDSVYRRPTRITATAGST